MDVANVLCLFLGGVSCVCAGVPVANRPPCPRPCRGPPRHVPRAPRTAEAGVLGSDPSRVRSYPASPVSKSGAESLYQTPASTPRSPTSSMAFSPGQARALGWCVHGRWCLYERPS